MMDCNDLQPTNIPFPIVINESGNTICFKVLHELKAPFSMVVT